MSHKRGELEAGLITAQVHVDITRDFTTVVITGILDGNQFEGLGTAKRSPHDKYNEQVGTDLALSRALIDAGLELERRALERA